MKRITAFILSLSLFFMAPLWACMMHDPVGTMHQWFQDEIQAAKAPHLYATLATVSEANKPTARVVQFSWSDKEGVLFYTHQNTQKVAHLAKNDYVSLNPWLAHTKKQITLNGKAVRLTKERLEKTWNEMPRWMQLRLAASDHKSKVTDAAQLEKKYKAIEAQYPDKVPMPETFVGYKIEPSQIVFYELQTPGFAKKHIADLAGKSWVVAQFEP